MTALQREIIELVGQRFVHEQRIKQIDIKLEELRLSLKQLHQGE